MENSTPVWLWCVPFLYWHDVSVHCISVFISYTRHNMYMCVCAYGLCVCMSLHIYMEGVGWLKTNMEGIWSWATCGTGWNCKSSHAEIFWICFENSIIHNKRDTQKNKSWICKQEHRFLSSERGTAVGSWLNSAAEHLQLNVKGFWFFPRRPGIWTNCMSENLLARITDPN